MLFSATAAVALATWVLPIIAHPLEPREDTLEWAQCDYDFDAKVPVQCTTLQVPLDWTNMNSSEMLNLELLRVKATTEPFMGSILFNPGGPGALGTQHVATQEASINR